jgi:hypothetical protein
LDENPAALLFEKQNSGARIQNPEGKAETVLLIFFSSDF